MMMVGIKIIIKKRINISEIKIVSDYFKVLGDHRTSNKSKKIQAHTNKTFKLKSTKLITLCI